MSTIFGTSFGLECQMNAVFECVFTQIVYVYVCRVGEER